MGMFENGRPCCLYCCFFLADPYLQIGCVAVVLAASIFAMTRGVPELLATELSTSVQIFESLGVALYSDSNFVFVAVKVEFD